MGVGKLARTYSTLARTLKYGQGEPLLLAGLVSLHYCASAAALLVGDCMQSTKL